MDERDTILLVAILAVNLALLSGLLWVRLRASGQDALAPRLIGERWLTFGLAFFLFRSMRQMLGGSDLRAYGMFAELSETGRQFAALGAGSKAWFVGGGLVALGLLIHLVISIGRACGAPLQGGPGK
jgi:hypothetical protein